MCIVADLRCGLLQYLRSVWSQTHHEVYVGTDITCALLHTLRIVPVLHAVFCGLPLVPVPLRAGGSALVRARSHRHLHRSSRLLPPSYPLCIFLPFCKSSIGAAVLFLLFFLHVCLWLCVCVRACVYNHTLEIL